MTVVISRGSNLLPFQPALERLSADAHEHFEGVPVTFEPAGSQDRPFSRLLRLRVVRCGSDVPLTYVFLKVFKSKLVDGHEDGMRQRILHDFTTTKRVHDAMSRWPGYGVVRPVACYPEQLAIITEQAEGRTLLDYVQTEASWFPGPERMNGLRDTLRRVARWLTIFQSAEGRGGAVSLDELRVYIDLRLTRLAGYHGSGFTDADRCRVLRHIDVIGALVPCNELESVAVHSDMSLGNVLVTPDRVVVLDFAMAKRGTALHDLTRINLQIELLAVKPQFRSHVIGELQRALLDGFDPSLKAGHPLFRLLTLLHRVNHLASLSLNRAALPEAMYNRLVRGRHRQWLEDELARGTQPCPSR